MEKESAKKIFEPSSLMQNNVMPAQYNFLAQKVDSNKFAVVVFV